MGSLDVFHHGPFLCIKFSAVWTFEHMHLLFGQVSVKMHVEQRFLGEDCVTHDTLVDHFSLGSCEGGMLGSDVPLGALGRFEGHRAIGALMKHLTVSCLNVGLDGVQTSEHNLTAGAPVADAPGKVQARFFQMGLKCGLTSSASTLWTHMGCAVLMDPLMG